MYTVCIECDTYALTEKGIYTMVSRKVTIDGNTAAAHVAYAFSDVAAIYPITPSSNMGEMADEWAAGGKKNMWGQTVSVTELQSEAGAAGAVHGSLVAGGLTTTFTASQGLLLMIPNMYKIAGELLPAVFHVSARALATHALSIYGDHSDVMSTRHTGFAMLASASVQETMDLALVAHLATLRTKVPFLHFFDGFRTSHEVQKVSEISYEEMRSLVDMEAVRDFRDRAQNPEFPKQRGTAQNPDIYFQGREASNKYYLAAPNIVADVMRQVGELTGRHHQPFDYVGAPDATHVIVIMGSGAETVEETVNYLNARGEKLGVVKVRLYRPFSAEHFLKVVPASVAHLAVLDRTKEPGSLGEPLYQDVCTVYSELGMAKTIIGGRFGLGLKEFTPSMVKAVFDNLRLNSPKNHFTVGINDDVTFTSLPVTDHIDTTPSDVYRCKFFGLGADGTVGANKNSIKIIGDHTDLYAQGYFVYDSKKSGGITVSHLRFGSSPIKSPYLVDEADFIACHHPSFVGRYDLLQGIKRGGTFLLNSPWTTEEMDMKLPASLRHTIAARELKFYNLDAAKIAREVGQGGRINTIMQVAFFALTKVMDSTYATQLIKDAIKKTYGKKGDAVVEQNFAAVERALSALTRIDYPATWADTEPEAKETGKTEPPFISDILRPMTALRGDELPVSAFSDDGVFPLGTSQYEKRGIALEVPVWNPETCIQCNQCAFVCPHAAIRPYLAQPAEVQTAPEALVGKPATNKELAGFHYFMQVSPLDCTGCGNCVDVCPTKVKSLTLTPLERVGQVELEKFEFLTALPEPNIDVKPTTVMNSQFKQPLFEYSGACAGCGETPYIKLLTQLFGDRMMIANATGCSSIYGGSAPSCPFTTNTAGRGPAWANSLFEDNAEFGYGMALAVAQKREKLAELLSTLAGESALSDELREACTAWVAGKQDADESRKQGDRIRALLPSALGAANDGLVATLREVDELSPYLTKKSIWVIGGDGWAYDIGFGGLDHVLASNVDINVLVLDTEVYSNTGGQSSKATPTGAIAKFATGGKRTHKKDLGRMMMGYGYVYVASICSGANRNQTLKAMLEAEQYPGPSLVIAYAPCIAHGIDMAKSQLEGKKAVECGYWPLYRYNPLLAEDNKNPFVLDFSKPTWNFREFLLGETRFMALNQQPEHIKEALLAQAERESRQRFANYLRWQADTIC